MELNLDKIYKDAKSYSGFENDHELAWACVVRVLDTVTPGWCKGRRTPIYNAMHAIVKLATPEPQPGDTELVYVYQMSSKPIDGDVFEWSDWAGCSVGFYEQFADVPVPRAGDLLIRVRKLRLVKHNG